MQHDAHIANQRFRLRLSAILARAALRFCFGDVGSRHLGRSKDFATDRARPACLELHESSFRDHLSSLKPQTSCPTE